MIIPSHQPCFSFLRTLLSMSVEELSVGSRNPLLGSNSSCLQLSLPLSFPQVCSLRLRNTRSFQEERIIAESTFSYDDTQQCSHLGWGGFSQGLILMCWPVPLCQREQTLRNNIVRICRGNWWKLTQYENWAHYKFKKRWIPFPISFLLSTFFIALPFKLF